MPNESTETSQPETGAVITIAILVLGPRDKSNCIEDGPDAPIVYPWARRSDLSRITKLHARIAEMAPHWFAQKISQDQAGYWDTDCGSWLCASDDVDHIAAKVQNQHHNR